MKTKDNKAEIERLEDKRRKIKLKRMKEILALQLRLNELYTDAHQESIDKYGHCRIPGCRCFKRIPFSFHRIATLVPPSPEPTLDQIKKQRAKARKLYP